MSHDNRFSKTNYLKTNLLKQIKKNIFIDLAVASICTISISIAKVQKKAQYLQTILLFFAAYKQIKHKNRDNSLRITPICYFHFANQHL